MLDTSAFVAGYDPLSITDGQCTVPAVKEEVAENSMAWVRFKTALESGKLKVKMPENVFLEKVKTAAVTVGDWFFLSEADLQVLALALQLKAQGYIPLVVTDDYSIQNVAKHLEIKYAPLATFGIRTILKWVRYCPACRRKYSASYKFRTCEVCGTELKRKPLMEKG
ncbi:MAG: ribonuclease VapC [Candidatus Bathyarchaeota archaeon]|nr:ribonuclease VapC [Candidatus Bathyarchaeota archaeon]